MAHSKKMPDSVSHSDKVIHQEQRTNINENDKHNRGLGDDSIHPEKSKKKTTRQESKDFSFKDGKNDLEFPPVAGLTFPSVKGAEGKSC